MGNHALGARLVAPRAAAHLALLGALLGTGSTAAETPKARRWEVGLLPAVTFNSDQGLGLGAVGSLARFEPGYRPYRLRIKALWYFTLRQAPDGSIEAPYHDDRIRITLPGLLGGRLRFEGKLGFARFSTLGYYGLGNASQARAPWEGLDPESSAYREARRFHQVDHTFPYLRLAARLPFLAPALRLYVAVEGSGHVVARYPQSQLAKDIERARTDKALADLLRGTEPHLQWLAVLGLLYDTRDHEIAPHRGLYHELSVRLGYYDHQVFGGVTANARAYVPLWRHDRLVLAARVLFDLLVGEPPFYELARAGGVSPDYAPGGGGIRGVPVGRYHGRVKLIGNLELRAQLTRFRVGKQQFRLGVLAFADAGRLWTKLRDSPDLDGSTLGLKVGLGGGLRLQWGQAFIIRGDVAWSADARPVGVYVDAHHLF